MNNIKLKIAVIGCGWLGAPLAEKLLRDRHEVHGTSRDVGKLTPLVENGLIAHEVTESFSNAQLDWLKNCEILVLNIPPSSFKSSYANKMCEIARNLPSTARVIFVSSTSVYADKNETVTETTPTDGTNRSGPYVIEAEEALVNEFGKRITIVRMAGLIGGTRHPAKFMAGKSISGGLAPVNLIHLTDCIGILKSVIHQNYWGKVLNACAPKHPEKKAYYTHFCKQLNLTPPTFEENKGDFKIVSAEKVQKELNYKFVFEDPYDFVIDGVS